MPKSINRYIINFVIRSCQVMIVIKCLWYTCKVTMLWMATIKTNLIIQFLSGFGFGFIFKH